MSFTTALRNVTIGVLGTGLAHQAQATLRSRLPHRGWDVHEVTGETRNVLKVHRREAGPGAPELFFEAGLMNTSSSWLLLADALAEDHTVTIYDRAGYRSSRRCQTEPYRIAESVSDAVDVVRALRSPGADAWVVGHSLGGYLAHRAASMLQDLTGVVLVDPMHPQELVASDQQREGSKSLDLTLRTGPITVALGGGLLMDRKNILKTAEGNPHARQLWHELSAYSTWATGLREWRFSYPFMLDGGAPLAQLDVPVHVIGASQTLDSSPEQRDLFDAYVASGAPGGTVTHVPDSTHLGIVSSAACRPAVLDALRRATTSDRAAATGDASTHDTNEETSHASR